MFLECAVLQESHDEYDTADLLNTHTETIPETYIVEFLWEAGFFYLAWMNSHSFQFPTRIIPELHVIQFSNLTKPRTRTI